MRQERDGWGGKVIDRLASDLRTEFPEMRGLSVRNLEYMRQFAASWPESQIPPQPVAQLPWGHIRCLLDKADDRAARLWYAQSAVEQAWSRKVLEHHIATGRYEREGKALTNFAKVLPDSESELVQQIVHEDYNFEFLGLTENVHERRLERSLVAEIERFMIPSEDGGLEELREFAPSWLRNSAITPSRSATTARNSTTSASNSATRAPRSALPDRTTRRLERAIAARFPAQRPNPARAARHLRAPQQDRDVNSYVFARARVVPARYVGYLLRSAGG